MIVIGILGILASVIVPSVSASRGVALESAARVVASDLRLARSLAIQHNTEWTVNCDVAANTYELEHTGQGNLSPPVNPLSPNDQSDRYIVRLDQWGERSRGGQTIQLRGVRLADSLETVANVTFRALGGTGPERSEDTEFWLSQGVAEQQQYLVIRVSWVTGQIWIETPDPTEIPHVWLRSSVFTR
jgi:Tfp pilus assembly protein FimT